jgi:hypothetical protein
MAQFKGKLKNSSSIGDVKLVEFRLKKILLSQFIVFQNAVFSRNCFYFSFNFSVPTNPVILEQNSSVFNKVFDAQVRINLSLCLNKYQEDKINLSL